MYLESRIGIEGNKKGESLSLSSCNDNDPCLTYGSFTLFLSILFIETVAAMSVHLVSGLAYSDPIQIQNL